MKKLIGVIAVALLVVAFSAPAGASASTPEANPSQYPEPEVPSRECERQAFRFADTGFESDPLGSLTRFRILGIFSNLHPDCGTRLVRLAVFDRKAGTDKAVRVSRWTKWTKWNTKRRFIRTVRTRPYRCGFYRTVYAEVVYSDILLPHTEEGSRSC